jgi:hypothetical protein
MQSLINKGINYHQSLDRLAAISAQQNQSLSDLFDKYNIDEANTSNLYEEKRGNKP